jgi:hypothetical protein
MAVHYYLCSVISVPICQRPQSGVDASMHFRRDVNFSILLPEPCSSRAFKHIVQRIHAWSPRPGAQGRRTTHAAAGFVILETHAFQCVDMTVRFGNPSAAITEERRAPSSRKERFPCQLPQSISIPHAQAQRVDPCRVIQRKHRTLPTLR